MGLSGINKTSLNSPMPKRLRKYKFDASHNWGPTRSCLWWQSAWALSFPAKLLRQGPLAAHSPARNSWNPSCPMCLGCPISSKEYKRQSFPKAKTKTSWGTDWTPHGRSCGVSHREGSRTSDFYAFGFLDSLVGSRGGLGLRIEAKMVEGLVIRFLCNSPIFSEPMIWEASKRQNHQLLLLGASKAARSSCKSESASETYGNPRRSTAVGFDLQPSQVPSVASSPPRDAWSFKMWPLIVSPSAKVKLRQGTA